ncbi:RNase H domain-containing protein [Trichonephila clavipes]|uniref:RNase H domain-containing protein n=1 Tax=Trichonephila clavipes TaxID=2585209 RepID=A0A8X6WEZ9_TRICX|nr:RNase H domain-containing protein [Trichonephila clavipes]
MSLDVRLFPDLRGYHPIPPITRSSIQYLSNWPSIGDSISRSILHLFQQLLDRHPIHLQWVPSHVGLLGNEVADDLAKAATSNPVDPEDHMVLTSTEIYSKAQELICRTWVVPHVHPWYFQRHPGSALSFKGSRSYLKRPSHDFRPVT